MDWPSGPHNEGTAPLLWILTPRASNHTARMVRSPAWNPNEEVLPESTSGSLGYWELSPSHDFHAAPASSVPRGLVPLGSPHLSHHHPHLPCWGTPMAAPTCLGSPGQPPVFRPEPWLLTCVGSTACAVSGKRLLGILPRDRDDLANFCQPHPGSESI